MISVIVPVLNEADNIQFLLDSFVVQTLALDEIIIVDGGSSDNTVAILESYQEKLPLRILHRPHGNISISRNLAISTARHDIIAATDAGLTLAPDWLEHITHPLLKNSAVSVVGGISIIHSHTRIETVIGAIDSRLPDEINPERFLPTSRCIAFRKSVWLGVGGYPEWLDYSEDLIFILRVKQGVGHCVYEPRAAVYYEPRSTPVEFFVQYYRYARGDGKADLWFKRHAARYLTYFVLLPLLIVLSMRVHPALWGILVAGMIGYLRAPYRRLFIALKSKKTRRAADVLFGVLLLPLFRLIGDVAKMTGYPIGRLWRWQQHPPEWRTVNGRA